MHEYIILNGVNMLTHYGLLLREYNVGAPAPKTYLIDVPGRPGRLDASEALTGKVVLDARTISITLHARNWDFENFHKLLSEVSRLVNSGKCRISFSTDPGWDYVGRFTVSYKKSNPVTGDITLTCKDAFPYKIDNTGETSGWTFDPTVFTEGVYYVCDRTVDGTADFVYRGFEYNGTVTIYSSVAGVSVTWSGLTFHLRAGKNTIYEIHLEEGDNTLSFSGTGRVRVMYERGIQ